MTFKTKKEAVTLANDSEFGLAAAVFTSDDAQLKRMTKNLRAGFAWNNSSQPCFVELPPAPTSLTSHLRGNSRRKHRCLNEVVSSSVESFVSHCLQA
ncbi:hypothetical protein PC129_g3433 [Phytophthora cactorum]|uniref:Aldehyde dehydrogenase domain-containing protein n=1 Tax=Phytophthora cactorum TaxID=29920 RepID=A0A8T1IKZ5_9STRA|nr:hypothetical protein PC112_g5478 [Phytophthora cactorum]KAG3183961.1 hypothetical protein C6341_g5252 [Phytophthora cactorum]KAG3225975.1 hypothetical protein PC129_g3433 [Phytophthora cactorum]KAG4063572.1 hypothetical protein PC123_g1641 [Phytophthora cactorum]